MTDTPQHGGDPEAMPTHDGMAMLGYGTWKLADRDTCIDAITTALETGYRHIDTARMYDNETHVGEAIANAGVDRDEVFLATKIWPDDLAYDDAIDAAYDSLDRLNTDHLDLLYVHWPARAYDPAETLDAFDRLVEEGVTDRIGVSNFTPELLADACDRTTAPIFANQFECHPLLPRQGWRDACAEHDVQPVAYAPIARQEVFEVETIVEIADAHDVSPAQVSLAWLRQHDVTAIPKAASADHIRDNWASLSCTLTEAELDAINAIETRSRKVNPEFAPWN
ncbi:2,5-diketo-D-gluconate reductase B [Halopenitus malekzadehii]|uniref:2,5-diketo-D-gluconate reductase B n=1 Tax=Halopenitus malekzadehii TaxID=1267564 RepID=A0A1H6HYJ1_9EURY|nr:2,5-diketo-D-gluconate reductase B [Halopenitus malekzadehii]